MLVNAGIADEKEEAELQNVQEWRKRHVETLPDHAWIIEPLLPDIIKEYAVAYVVNDRDVVRFAKLARSNSILGLSDFIIRALEDWKEKPIFQKMAITPPDEMLNYFEYYISLLVKVDAVENLKAVEQVLINADPVFAKFEIELWRRIAYVLTERGDIDRLYDSSCRFVEYLKSVEGLIQIRNEAADVIKEYCVGLHNSGADDKFSDLLQKIEEFELPKNSKFGTILCENYRMLIDVKYARGTDYSNEWDRVKGILQEYEYSDELCEVAMKAAHNWLLGLIQKSELDGLRELEGYLEGIYDQHHIPSVANVLALTTANIYTITVMKQKKRLTNEYVKLKGYLREYPEEMQIRSAFVAVAKEEYLETSSFRKAPETIINNAKAWSLQYPDEIEFQESYFGLLLAKLEYAQAHDMRNEQKRVFKEMKELAARADYSEYLEQNQLQETIELLQHLYGY